MNYIFHRIKISHNSLLQKKRKEKKKGHNSSMLHLKTKNTRRS